MMIKNDKVTEAETRRLVEDLCNFLCDRFDAQEEVFVEFLEDEENASNPFGKTAFYDPSKKCISIYITNRHPKDILRSFAHEFVHHVQNCDGKFEDPNQDFGPGYAQKDGELRSIEKEAFLKGNMAFRDWEDSKKASIVEIKNLTRSKMLLRKFGIKMNI